MARDIHVFDGRVAHKRLDEETQGCVWRGLYADIGAPGQFRKIMGRDQAHSSLFLRKTFANLPLFFPPPLPPLPPPYFTRSLARS